MNSLTVRGSRPRLALVCMPWNSITLPSMALSLLKPCAVKAGWDVDVHYLNLKFAVCIGLELYEHIANRSAFYPEWFFSAQLFGRDEVVSNAWEKLQTSERGRLFCQELIEHCNGSAEAVVKVADAVEPFINGVLSEIDWRDYDVVGFTITHAQTCTSLLLSQHLKQLYPDIQVVFGGPAVDGDMGIEMLRAFSWADYVVQGEAERAFTDLLTHIANGLPVDAIAGVSSRRSLDAPTAPALIERMDDLPTPDHDDFFRQARRYSVDKRLRVAFTIECSRGCWWGEKQHCTFCGLNGNAMHFRSKSAKHVFEEVMSLAHRYRCLNVLAVDKILDMNYCRELFPLLQDAGFDLNIFFEVKSNLTNEQVYDMARAGVRRIQPGIESFNTDVLRLMRKGVTAIQNIQFLKSCVEAGIEPFWNLLYGFPGEKAEHYEGLDQLMRRLVHLAPPVDVSPIVFERFSPYVSFSDSFGLTLDPASAYSYLFPRFVDMRKLGFYFETPVVPDTGYMDPAIEAFREWRRLWQESRRPVLICDEGPRFVVIYDTRPKIHGNSSEPFRIVLGGIAAEIYSYCHTHRSRNAITRFAQSRGAKDADVQLILDDCVANGLMFQEGSRYLALAVTPGRMHRRTARISYDERPQPANNLLRVI